MKFYQRLFLVGVVFFCGLTSAQAFDIAGMEIDLTYQSSAEELKQGFASWQGFQTREAKYLVIEKEKQGLWQLKSITANLEKVTHGENIQVIALDPVLEADKKVVFK